MISISLSSAFLLYLTGALLLLFTAWLLYHYRYTKRKIIPCVIQCFLCEYCQSTYLGRRASVTTRCPECHCLNKNNPYFHKN